MSHVWKMQTDRWKCPRHGPRPPPPQLTPQQGTQIISLPGQATHDRPPPSADSENTRVESTALANTQARHSLTSFPTKANPLTPVSEPRTCGHVHRQPGFRCTPVPSRMKIFEPESEIAVPPLLRHQQQQPRHVHSTCHSCPCSSIVGLRTLDRAAQGGDAARQAHVDRTVSFCASESLAELRGLRTGCHETSPSLGARAQRLRRRCPGGSDGADWPHRAHSFGIAKGEACCAYHPAPC